MGRKNGVLFLTANLSKMSLYIRKGITISNGLALCPTLHRAFDRGLVAIDPNTYRVLVLKRLFEPISSTYSIQQFSGGPIQLPDDSRYFPGRENLQNHLSRYAANF